MSILYFKDNWDHLFKNTEPKDYVFFLCKLQRNKKILLPMC